MNRRAFLRGAAAVPAAGAAIAAQATQMAQAGMLAEGGGLVSGMSLHGLAVPAAPSGGIKIFSFLQWLKEGGERELRASARNIHGLDPDLLAMQSLPFATKVRIQRQRNYERLKDERRGYVEDRLRRDGGSFEWWP